MAPPATLQVVRPDSSPPEVTKEKIVEYLSAFGLTKELTENERNQFIQICQEFQLNPFKREIHCVPYGEGEYRKLSIIVGYETYIKRAERTGKLDGWKAWVEGSGEEAKAVVEIYRKDWQHPFRHESFWKEAVQKKRDGSTTAFWKKQPMFQLRKVAISQAFRLCFPDELGGMPYDPNELPEEMAPASMRNVTPEKDTESEGLEALSSTPESGTQIGRPEEPVPQVEKPDPKESKLSAEIRSRVKANEDCFAEGHLKWVLSEIEKDGSEKHLQGLSRHVEEVIRRKRVDEPLARIKEKASRTQESVPAEKEEVLIF